MLKFKSRILFIFIFVSLKVRCQVQDSDLKFAKTLVSDKSVNYDHLKAKKALLPFKLYKLFFSSQDVPNVCRFHPSCSEYGLLSIEKKGFILGSLATFDRLTRCNGKQTSKFYLFENESKRFLDFP